MNSLLDYLHPHSEQHCKRNTTAVCDRHEETIRDSGLTSKSINQLGFSSPSSAARVQQPEFSSPSSGRRWTVRFSLEWYDQVCLAIDQHKQLG